MENKRSKRGGEDPAWMSKRQQDELDEADRFQVRLCAIVDLRACKAPPEAKLSCTCAGCAYLLQSWPSQHCVLPKGRL